MSDSSQPTSAAPSREPLAVSRAEAGMKLAGFLERRLDPEVPRAAIMRWIRTGQVRVDGGRAKPFDRLAEGALVRLPPQAHEQLRRRAAEPENGASARNARSPLSSVGREAAPDLDIAYQDERLLVLAKPAGLPTQPGSKHDDSLAARLAARFAEADYVPAPAHRLDRDTSGLVLAGLTHEAQFALHELFAGRGEERVVKDYLAWAEGDWPSRQALLMEDRLDRTGERGRERVQSAADGRLALAAAALLNRREGASLLLVRLYTGRRHQIRVQLASRGHPILGDRKYGGPAFRDNPGLALHAWRLEVPGFGVFESPPAWRGALALVAGTLQEARGLDLPKPRARDR